MPASLVDEFGNLLDIYRGQTNADPELREHLRTVHELTASRKQQAFEERFEATQLEAQHRLEEAERERDNAQGVEANLQQEFANKQEVKRRELLEKASRIPRPQMFDKPKEFSDYIYELKTTKYGQLALLGVLVLACLITFVLAR
jgi:lysyl-tRNA synthetase class I